MRSRLLLALGIGIAVSSSAHAAPDWSQVAQALGKSGAVQADGVYRVGLPRTDLSVALDGVQLEPGFALGSWLGFRPVTDREAVVMGDLVLTEPEVNPVMTKLTEAGIEITGLHNHLLRATPATMYLHVHGHGDPVALARALHGALQESRTPLMPTSSSTPQASTSLDLPAIERALGHKGTMNGDLYQVSVPRADPVRDNGMDVPASLGSANAINFEPTGSGKAAITGDLVLTADEVNPVLHALRASGIEVTAIHNHMLLDEPRLFFMHFWGTGTVEDLAKGMGEALKYIKLASKAE